MNTLPNHKELKLEIALQDALAEMERRATGAVSQESSNGWRHAMIICRNGWDVQRKLWQLQYHAKRHQEGAPVKAAAYREAMAVLMEHTGEEPKLEITPDHEHAAPEEPFALVAT